MESSSEQTQADPWTGRTVLVTGAVGTVGREIISQLAQRRNVRSIIGVDNNETELFFSEHLFSNYSNIFFVLADIKELHSLASLTRGVDILIHTAGFKHVSLCEHAPQAAVQTNIIGTQNVIEAAQAGGVQRVLFTSSDKAVNPTNVMGTSKLMAERLMTAANAQSRRNGGTIFASSRFGNVLGSRGSVIPLFKQQIAAGGPVTLTDTGMTRFIMTLGGAVKLVMESAFLAQGGEVFVTKMPVCRIDDLAHIMIEELAPRHNLRPQDIEVKVVGSRPGEKKYEELMNEEEIRRAVEIESYFVITPALQSIPGRTQYDYPGMRSARLKGAYNSASTTPFNREELREYLLTNRFLTV